MFDSEIDISFDLEIVSAQRQATTKGVWVTGHLAGHRFQALVFEHKAQRSEWELHGSRISKLWVQRLEDKRVVFHWDRGPDIAPANEIAEAIVDFLCAGLADRIFQN